MRRRNLISLSAQLLILLAHLFQLRLEFFDTPVFAVAVGTLRGSVLCPSALWGSLSVWHSCLWPEVNVIHGVLGEAYQDYFWGWVFGTHASQVGSWSNFEVVRAGRLVV